MEGLLRNETFRDKFKGKLNGLIISTCNLIEEDARFILVVVVKSFYTRIFHLKMTFRVYNLLERQQETLTATTKKPDNIKSGMPSYRRESSV